MSARRLVLIAGASCFAMAACSATSDTQKRPPGAAAGAAGGAGGTTLIGPDAGNAGGFGPDASCVSESIQGESVPVDMYVMLDTSGSMQEAIAGGGSKWTAVQNAMVSFIDDPRSTGLGVGLQFFPLPDPSVPDTCTSSAQCGGAGPCFLRVCEGIGVLEACDTDADCAGACVDLGVCENTDPQEICFPDTTPTCAGGQSCLRVGSAFCANAACSIDAYSSPEVAIETLPAHAADLHAAISAKELSGRTPTGAALRGAIDHAKAHAEANPSHAVVTVFATDGIPTECDPRDSPSVAQIALEGRNGSPSIRTFVIGVFGANDASGRKNADQLAMAGGTDSAFIVDPSSDVSQQFLDALDAIRGSTLRCEYQIPTPSEGDTLDFGKVNVTLTDEGAEPETLLFVGGEDGCDPDAGGWYYDADPSKNEVPTKIIVCPQTCDAIHLTVNNRVDIALGCGTAVR